MSDPRQLRLFNPDDDAPAEVAVTITPAVPGAAVEKRCSRCGLEKPRTEFHKARHSKDGLNGRCRVCDAEYKADRARKLKAGETVARNRELPRGVTLRPSGKYEAEYRHRYLGKFASADEAAAAYATASSADPIGVPVSAYWVDDVFAEAVGARHWNFVAAGYLSAHGNAGDDFARISQHQYVWRLAGGSVPDGLMLDHIDHDRTNNRLANLRLISVKGNGLNRRKPTAPRLRPSGRWQAKVADKTLGTFSDKAEAQAVINAHVADLIEQETVMHGSDLLASYMATTQATVGSLTTARAL